MIEPWYERWPKVPWREVLLTPPVDLALVSSALGLAVSFHDWPHVLSGTYVPLPGGAGAIGLNANHCPARIRFSWAHEIGHHLACDVGCYSSDRFRTRSKREKECNRFAANLLMPPGLVATFRGSIATADPRRAIQLTAAAFGVSLAAALREEGVL